MKYFLHSLILVALLTLAAVPFARASDIDLLGDFSDIYWMDSRNSPQKAEGCTADDSAADMTPFPSSITAVPTGTRPAIAIVIDDMGLDHKRSPRAVNLPAGVTLAYLPYSPHVSLQTKAAAAKGHELMVHLPMAPEGMRVNPGPNYLGVDHSPEELKTRINANLNAFGGYVGVNNHMGSAFTQDRAGMDILVQELKARGVYFLDSMTAPESIGEKAARAASVRTTHRDVFLDHYEDMSHVLASLERLERIARKTGAAVAIGHPKDVTLDALEKWLPTLQAKGFDLVPMSELINRRMKMNAPYTAAAQATPVGMLAE